ncbi:MAG: hypothetical protein MJ131_07920 [Lachnospiraceae bacterium]|nr:hypothetical protein [Lachnospiraceae bacterium]
MKKSTWISVIIAVAVFVAAICFSKTLLQDTAVYEDTVKGIDYSSQKAHIFGRDYVFVWNNSTLDTEYYRLDDDTVKLVEKLNKQGAGECIGQIMLGQADEVNILTDRIYTPSSAVEAKLGSFFRWNCFLSMLIWYPALAAVIIFLLVNLIGKRSAVTKLYCAAQLLLFLIFAGFIFFFAKSYINEFDRNNGERLASAIQYKTAANENSASVYSIYPDLIDIFKSDARKLTLTISDSHLHGSDIVLANYYEKSVAEAIRMAAGQKESYFTTLWRSNIRMNVLACYGESDMNDGVITVAVLGGNRFSEEAGDFLDRVFIRCLFVFLAVSLLMLLAYIIYQLRWRKLVNSIKTIVVDKGDCSIPTRNIGGYTSLWNGLAETSKALGNVKYDVRQGLQFSARFVPKNLFRLFGSADLKDVSIGDSRLVKGCMVQVSIDSLKMLSCGEYLETLNKVNSIFLKNQEKADAIRINSDSDLKKNKFFFESNENEAVDFAVNVCGGLKEEQMTRIAKRLVIINSSEYNCGIAGSDEQIIPFVYSKDDEILEAYEDRLRAAGLEIVLTENVLNNMASKNWVRYIGYISSPDGRRTIKLYEALDVYSDFKRKVIMSTEQKFQKALRLFYSDDFYLARNTFNEVLQVNSEDNIARWYLFTCEHYLNEGGNVDVSYSLFSEDVFSK